MFLGEGLQKDMYRRMEMLFLTYRVVKRDLETLLQMNASLAKTQSVLSYALSLASENSAFQRTCEQKIPDSYLISENI